MAPLLIRSLANSGKYIPFMSDFIYAQPGAKAAGINLQGIAINDPSFAEDIVTEELPALQFAKKNAKFMNLSPQFLAGLEAKAEKAGIADYVEKNLVYPPKGLLPSVAAWQTMRKRKTADLTFRTLLVLLI